MKTDKKIVGGGLTGQQLHDFIDAVYTFVNNNASESQKENETKVNTELFKDGFVPLKGLKTGFIDYTLRKREEIDSLYNDKFKVYFNVRNGHVVACHRGTFGDSISSWVKDIGNNLRNPVVETENLITYRNLIAKKGHNDLMAFFEECYKNRDLINTQEELTLINVSDYIENPIIVRNIITKYISEFDTTKKTISPVQEYLKEKLTTIGHSQGAIYAYLYGDTGKETITFNPAPFPKIKPKNTYDVRIDTDGVSVLSGVNFTKKNPDVATKIVIRSRRKKEYNIKTSSHMISAIIDSNTKLCFFGDKTLFSLNKKDLLDNNPKNCPVEILDISKKDTQNVSLDDIKIDGGKRKTRKYKRKIDKRKKKVTRKKAFPKET